VHPTGFVDPKKPLAKEKTLCAELLRGVGGVLVSENGERFVNELGTRDYISNTMAKVAKMNIPSKGDTPERLHFTILLNPNSAAEADKHVPLYSAKGLLQKFETLADVAHWRGISPDTLLATLRRYNEAAAKGLDEHGKVDFKHAPWVLPHTGEGAAGGPFYAGTVTPVVHYCMGGLAVSDSGVALRQDGTPIPGLYATGELIGGVHGDNRLGGNALTECVVFGRTVGAAVPLATDAKAHSDAAVGTDAAEEATASTEEGVRHISVEELAQHQSEEDSWVEIHGKVYDMTEFAEDHPGGPESIWNVAGKDGTHNFDTVHTIAMLEDFEVVGVTK